MVCFMRKEMWTSRTLSIGFMLLFLMCMGVVSSIAETANQARTNLQIVVTGTRKVGSTNETGPVVNAQVLVKSEVPGENFEEPLSTDSHGIANVSNVPRGPVLIQVTAQGWINGGIRQQLAKKDETISIVLTAEGGASPSPTPAPSPSPSATPSPSPTPTANY
jgi:hypothetical protein